jgi:hypothetical protein
VRRRARQRRVDHGDAARGQFRRQPLRHLRPRGRGVDDGAHARPLAGHRRDGLLHLRRAGHAQHDNVGLAPHRREIWNLDRAARNQILDRLAPAVGADAQRPALLHRVLRHAPAHQADADEADHRFRVHALSPSQSV